MLRQDNYKNKTTSNNQKQLDSINESVIDNYYFDLFPGKIHVSGSSESVTTGIIHLKD